VSPSFVHASSSPEHAPRDAQTQQVCPGRRETQRREKTLPSMKMDRECRAAHAAEWREITRILHDPIGDRRTMQSRERREGGRRSWTRSSAGDRNLRFVTTRGRRQSARSFARLARSRPAIGRSSEQRQQIRRPVATGPAATGPAGKISSVREHSCGQYPSAHRPPANRARTSTRTPRRRLTRWVFLYHDSVADPDVIVMAGMAHGLAPGVQVTETLFYGGVVSPGI
jgi:hypothetical protein